MRCPICSSNQIEIQADYRFANSCFENLKRVKCLDCELHFANPMPNDQALDYYNKSYHESAHKGVDREKDKIISSFYSGIAKTRLDFIIKHVNVEKNLNFNVLEIGPGPGEFVKVWKKNYPKSNYFVLESDKNCHPSLKSLGSNIIEEKNLDAINIKFDFLIISHVLEHVKNPNEFLKYFTSKLKENAFAFIEVPCNDWMHKDKDEPHLLFFDKKAMSVLLKNINVKLVKLAYYGLPISRLNNKIIKFLRRLRSFSMARGISIYHPEKTRLNKILNNTKETNSLLNFDAHIEQNEPSWWLRVIYRKN
tara:strand:- start:606 stop:1526 length:921 start_codon:yes stop_codon:yes gene_type:complete